MGILGFNIPEETQRAIVYTGIGAAGAIFIPKGVTKLGQYMGRNVAQEVRASLNPGMLQPGIIQPGMGAGYNLGSLELYSRLTAALEKIVSMTSEYGKRIADLESMSQKKGG